MTSVRPTTWVEVETGMYLLDPNGTPWYVAEKVFAPGAGWTLTLREEFFEQQVTRPADAPTNALEPSPEQARDLVARMLGGTVIDEGGTP